MVPARWHGDSVAQRQPAACRTCASYPGAARCQAGGHQPRTPREHGIFHARRSMPAFPADRGVFGSTALGVWLDSYAHSRYHNVLTTPNASSPCAMPPKVGLRAGPLQPSPDSIRESMNGTHAQLGKFLESFYSSMATPRLPTSARCGVFRRRLELAPPKSKPNRCGMASEVVALPGFFKLRLLTPPNWRPLTPRATRRPAQRCWPHTAGEPAGVRMPLRAPACPAT